jgi:hypothetical protein
MTIFNPLLLGKMKKYRSIHGKDVAKTMISVLQKEQVKLIYESDEIKELSEKN